MKTATAKELRTRAATILEQVIKGGEVIITKRGKPIAVLKPLREEPARKFSPVGFGQWKSREDLKGVSGWLDKRRKDRFER